MKRLGSSIGGFSRIFSFILNDKEETFIPKSTLKEEDLEECDAEWEMLEGEEDFEFISLAELPAELKFYGDSHDFSEVDEKSQFALRLFQRLALEFPANTITKKLRLIYGSNTHGFSLQTLYRNVKAWDETEDCSSCVLLIKDSNGHSFGVICTSLPGLSDNRISNDGEMKLFKTLPYIQIYPWSCKNYIFMQSQKEYLRFGASEAKGYGPALWIEGDLMRGTSMKCETFDSDVLSTQEDFEISEVELWGFSLE